ncbi:MAG: hypothetical protein GOV15_03905, partial [Candidatus Diapherotrites archaeon]|nr:hypothetical protein [Candidatus Diapherotrites archaeon]
MAQRPRAAGGVDYLANISNQLSAMSASINVLEQKLTQVGRNETLLNRNFITLSKKLKDLEKRVASGGGSGGASEETLKPIQESIEAIKKDIETVKTSKGGGVVLPSTMTPEDILKLKHIVNT